MIPADELFGSAVEDIESPSQQTEPPNLTVVASGGIDRGIRLDSIDAAITAIRAGRSIVVIDDEDRENEGDLIFAASAAPLNSSAS